MLCQLFSASHLRFILPHAANCEAVKKQLTSCSQVASAVFVDFAYLPTFAYSKVDRSSFCTREFLSPCLLRTMFRFRRQSFRLEESMTLLSLLQSRFSEIFTRKYLKWSQCCKTFVPSYECESGYGDFFFVSLTNDDFFFTCCHIPPLASPAHFC